MADELVSVSWSQLSGSSQRALEWASSRANEPTYQANAPSKGQMLAEVSTPDVLAGILLAHPQGDTSPHQLLHHFGVPLDNLNQALGIEPDLTGHPERLTELPLFDSEAQQAIEQSFSLAKQYNAAEEGLVRLRDLFGGLLLTSNKAHDLLQECLRDIPFQFDELTSSYPDFLRYPSKDMSYTQFLAERFPPKKKPSPIRFAVSGFDADIRTAQDLVGIGAEVDAFAYLIAAKDLKPPLAIGLFGDWGSGKSFFMESLRQRIHKITEDARTRGRPQKNISIFKSVVQIDFNAWHYVGGNLWASLVEHIFRNLQTSTGDDKNPTLLQQRQQFWIKKIDEARQKQQVVLERKDELENQLSKKQKEIRDLETERDKKLKELAELEVQDVLAAMELSEGDKKKLEETLKKWGVTSTYESTAELVDAFEKLHAQLRRSNTFINLLRERGWGWILGFILVLLSGPVISLLINWVSQSQVPAITNALASISAFLSGLTVMIKWGTSRLSKALDEMENRQFKLDQKRREAEKKYAEDLAKAKQQYDEAKVAYEQAKSEEITLAAEIEALEQELQRVTPGRVLLDFINERVGSEDYRKHLGITALIRRDFDQLSQLIEQGNKDFIATDKGKKQGKNEKSQAEDQHRINRIVLYIDDLDRCPPQRVVEVLQAVHLLLAFPLFVVVVAVDARWLSQSLQKHYEDLLVTTRQRDGLTLFEDSSRQATPQDYLEKIFQVPFWIRPLPASARLRLVQGLVAGSLVMPSTPGSTHQVQTREPSSSDGGQPGHTSEQTVEDQKLAWSEKEQRPLKLDIKTDLRPASLEIQLFELQFIKDLQTLLGRTPRSVKRFVNVYRLIKAMALTQTASFADDKPQADFKLVLFLLAVLTGLPIISREFFRLLREPDVERTGNDEEVSAGRTLGTVVEELRRWLANPSHSQPVRGAAVEQEGVDKPDPENGSGYEEGEALHELELLATWVKQYDHGAWLKLDATRLAEWLPQVGRFSFRFEVL